MNTSEPGSFVEERSTRVDSIIRSREGQRAQLVSLLQDVQAELNYLPADILVKVSEELDIPLTKVVGVATFFKSLSLAPRGRHILTVCLGTACHVRKGHRLVDAAERELGVGAGETTGDGRFTLETVNCLGCCSLGPVAVIDGKYHSKVTPELLKRALDDYR